MSEAAAKSKWSAEETHEFLLRVIDQQSQTGTFKPSDITMPGRTPKAVTHMWARVRAEITKLKSDGASEDGAGPSTKAAKATAKTGKKNKNEASEDAEGETPKKKARKSATKKKEVTPEPEAEEDAEGDDDADAENEDEA